MENTELMIYDDIVTEPVFDNKEYSFAAILAFIVGLIGILAAGGALPGNVSELIPTAAATAAPGLVAWVLSYLYANADDRMDYEEVPELE